MLIMNKDKEELIKKVQDVFDKRVAEINARREYRMRNYYECVDDYSFGGICDKADNELEDIYRIERDILIEQINNDGHYYHKSSFYRLRNTNNGNVANGAFCGQYGLFFAIDGKYISLPKKVATLAKKGYILECIERTYKCVFKKISDKGNVINAQMECVDEKCTIVTQETMPEYVGRLPYYDWQYEEFFNNK